MIQVGLTGHMSQTITTLQTAESIGSGTLPVFGTPAVLTLIEKTAWTSVQPYLTADETTVGATVNLTHSAPNCVGDTITCETKLTTVDGRRLTFAARVFDAAGEVARAEHTRVIVSANRFMKKADQRSAGADSKL